MRRFSNLASTVARSRAWMVSLTAVVVLAVAGTTLGYTAMADTVTLTVDGEEREISARAATVGDVLADEGIELGSTTRSRPRSTTRSRRAARSACATAAPSS